MILMKRTIFLLLTLIIISKIYSQENENPITQLEAEISLYESISEQDKKQKNIHIDFHTRAGFDVNTIGSETKAKFSMREARIDIRGQLTNKLSFRYRQKLNESFSSSGNIDNLPGSLDVLRLDWKFSDKWSIQLGKQAVSYGGFEYDLNPILIYDYSETLNSVYGFMTGINLIYNFNSGHELQFQVVNSRMKENIDDVYGVGFKDISLPFMYTLNWNGNFNNKFLTRWSATLSNQAKGKQAYFFTMGNQLNLGKASMYLDLNYHTKDIDDNGAITSIIGRVNGHDALDVIYRGIVYQVDYRLTPKWNFFGRVSFDNASINKSHENINKGSYRNTIGYQSGIEFYPIQKSNLHFYLAYIGKSHKFTDKAKSFDSHDYNENRIGIGFIYTLPVF